MYSTTAVVVAPMQDVWQDLAQSKRLENSFAKVVGQSATTGTELVIDSIDN